MQSGTMYNSLMSKNNCISVISCAVVAVPYKCNNYTALEMTEKSQRKCPQHVATEASLTKNYWRSRILKKTERFHPCIPWQWIKFCEEAWM